MSSQPQTLPPQAELMHLLNGGLMAQSISVIATLGIPDLLASGPKTAEELAAKTGAHPVALYRLMRATASLGILSEGADGKFSQTPLSEPLRSDAKPGIRDWAVLVGTEWYVRGGGDMEHCVRTNSQAIPHLYGKHAFEFIFEDPQRGELFNRAMTSLSTLDSPAVAAAYSFEGMGSIVDVAGGHGLLLATILQRNPHLKGTLYDLPQVVEGAKNGPLKPFADRCTFAGGDMFSSVPPGADAYIMKHIIHDWPDDRCTLILKACRQGVKPSGKLLVVDSVIAPGNGFDPAKFLDLAMLLFPSGLERTEKQFGELLAASGWKLSRVIPTPAGIHIVEGVPA
jgi:hypothetical protein